MDLVLGDTRVLDNFLDWRDALLEHGHAKFLKLGSCDCAIEVFILTEGINFDGGLCGRREDSLCSFTLGSESSDGSSIASDINTLLLHEFGTAVFDQLVVEIFTSQMGVSCSSLDFEHSFFNGKKGDIESTTSEIENQNVLFTLLFLIKSIGNSSGGGFINDSQNVDSSNDTSILSGLSLRIVEIGGNSDDGILDGLS